MDAGVGSLWLCSCPPHPGCSARMERPLLPDLSWALGLIWAAGGQTWLELAWFSNPDKQVGSDGPCQKGSSGSQVQSSFCSFWGRCVCVCVHTCTHEHVYICVSVHLPSISSEPQPHSQPLHSRGQPPPPSSAGGTLARPGHWGHSISPPQ